MPKKSLVQRSEVDQAQRAHNCQANAKHRVERGDRRLKLVYAGRSPDHYCLDCGLKIIQQDIAELEALARKLKGEC
uniref:Uncharacterized protein n=1 Tax=Candidatus Kentrum sp. LPFa TaxID=2126335 RepID=A0A450X088_9GAMM|nr:MAG: hypothetical protein BECKLPF1236A_GA0070988_103524 [Candidatus Kentron sp. LPFa]VFK35078.1 MAG: hypothetical protein BECKLPF1236C_GA0070990_103303 [Candidatus Kentron sp. LPFa]